MQEIGQFISKNIKAKNGNYNEIANTIKWSTNYCTKEEYAKSSPTNNMV